MHEECFLDFAGLRREGAVWRPHGGVLPGTKPAADARRPRGSRECLRQTQTGLLTTESEWLGENLRLVPLASGSLPVMQRMYSRWRSGETARRLYAT